MTGLHVRFQYIGGQLVVRGARVSRTGLGPRNENATARAGAGKRRLEYITKVPL